ncbi:hypothetical protein CTEN210_03296 [Chaetoceros tenuissimus]|uniref:Uncharacterized protein n=1 Tax=Chaetoceros tenuissimus TaxID=426638 RepID=A0AAD3CIS4_9STRA|nr:hypothetical protein CTEN210_03296 [Chaetoceros tenuissimus]
MSSSLKAAQIIRCINAFISCLASTFIVLMILTEPETGLASPYSRIIFAMSIADIFFSLGLGLSPFVGPKDNPDALFAIGTTGLCEAVGFIHIIGLLCLVFYTVFLTYYFLKRIRYKRSPSDFAKKEEKYFHVLFIMFSLAVSVAGLVTGSINPLSHGSICQIVSYPPNCERSSDIICERAPIIKLIQEQFFGYGEEPEWRFWLGALFTPLGGVFNILVYTRPKVMKVMETLSSTSYLRCFIVVVVSGGDVPSFADLISSSPMNSHSSHVHESGQVEDFHEDDALSMSSGVSSMDISKASSLMARFGWSSQICSSSISKPKDAEESFKVDS